MYCFIRGKKAFSINVTIASLLRIFLPNTLVNHILVAKIHSSSNKVLLHRLGSKGKNEYFYEVNCFGFKIKLKRYLVILLSVFMSSVFRIMVPSLCFEG